jgi:hypothetical protein
VSALSFACSGSGRPKAAPSDIVSVIPWPSSESLSYVLKDKAGKETGRAVLTVAVEGLTTRLGQEFTSSENTDLTSVIVDAKSLKPVSATRTITSATNKEELSVGYTSAGASIKQGDKQSGLTVPDHSYDNDTSLFLWRTIRFEPGYNAAYVAIITNRRSRQTAQVKVIGKETVKVPAGEFTTWRVEIDASGGKQTAWYADTTTRPLVKYDNSIGTFFELASKP